MAREKKQRASFEDISSDTAKQAYKKNKKRQKHIGTVIAICCLSSLLILIGCSLMGVSALMLNDLTTTQIAQDNGSLGISFESQDRNVINIALFGVEAKGTGDTLVGPCAGAAILSVNTKRNEVKVVSVATDISVDIGAPCPHESGVDSLSMSYAYGGPECAVRVLNSTLGLDIRDYVSVDMNGLHAFLTAFEESAVAEQSVSETVLNSLSSMQPEEYPRVLAQVLGCTETSLPVGKMLRLCFAFTDPFTVERVVVSGEVQNTEAAPDVQIDKTQAAKAVRDFLYS